MRHIDRYLFLIVVLCLILLSQTAMGDDPAAANREALKKCLMNLAARAQRYYHTLTSEGGPQGSFATTTLATLTSKSQNAYGSFQLSAPSATSVTLTGAGIETGADGSTPVIVTAIVYSDSIKVYILN